MNNIYGWLSLLGITYATSLLIQNMLNPHQKTKRVNLHCTISKLTIPTIAAHLLSQKITDINDWITWSGLGIYLIIMASGIVLMYLPDAGKLRYHARSVHPALLIGLSISLLHHVLTMLDIL